MNKICPYLMAGILAGSRGISEQYYNCKMERCEMWSTTMKTCSQRGFFDDKKSTVEVTKDQLANILDKEGGIGGPYD